MILTVDDSEFIRAQLELFLEEWGYSVAQAVDGAHGLAIALDEAIDFFIVDMNMPIMNGLDMVERIRALPQYATTPIMMLTTDAGREDTGRGRSLGVNSWMRKPLRPELLKERVEMLLRQHKEPA